jgi:monoamine oxidase
MPDVDVVIIGAGFAGLSAADRLNELSKVRQQLGGQGISYVVLEGAMRAGGRTMTRAGCLDMGGQYLAPEVLDPAVGGVPQSAAWSLVNRFGIETFATYLPDDKQNIYQAADGTIVPFQGNYPAGDTPEVVALVAHVEALVAAMRGYVGRPWLFPDAQQLDGLSVRGWLDRNVPDAAMKELFVIALRSAFSVEPENCSLLHFLHYAASCGSFAAFENVKGGGDAIRFRFGTVDLIDKLVAAVGGGKTVLYAKKVTRILQDAEGCMVDTESPQGNETWRAKRVVVAMSPSASTTITFEPPLPEARIQLTEGMPMASTIKGFAIFKTPWWRDKYSGYILSAHGPADWMMDNTWEDQDGKLSKPSLMTFIVGEQAMRWGNGTKTPVARQEAVTAQIAALFGKPLEYVKAQLDSYVDQDWGSDVWGRGCPAGCIAPNVLTRSVDGRPIGEALYQAVGRIHWAGSETGLRWMGGYMNGAIDSGIRVADEVAAFV